MLSSLGKLIGYGTRYFAVPNDENNNHSADTAIALTTTQVLPKSNTTLPPRQMSTPVATTPIVIARESSQPNSAPPSSTPLHDENKNTIFADEKHNSPQFDNKIYYALEVGSSNVRIGKNNVLLPTVDPAIHAQFFQNHDGTSPKDLFYFIYKLYPDICELITNFTEKRGVLKNIPLSKPTFAVAEKLNFALREVILRLELLEMQSGLASNYFINAKLFDENSIGETAIGLMDWVKNLGYEFPPADCYPYHVARLAQIEDIFKNSSEESQLKPILITRHQEIKNDLQIANTERIEEQKATKAKITTAKSAKIIRLIDQRIAQLEKEKTYWFARSKEKTKKIEGLNIIKASLIQQPLEQVLTYIESSPHLAEGPNSFILKQMHLTTKTNLDRINLIDLEIEKLEKSRNKIFSNKLNVEKRILALNNLRSLLNKPGYLLEEAQNILSSEYPEDYKILQKHEKKLLAEITEIDQAITDKITEICLDSNEQSRATYPHYLHKINKIVETELADGKKYHEIHGEPPSDNGFDHDGQDDFWSIDKINIKKIKPTVAFENTSGAILGKKRIAYQAEAEISAHMGDHNSKISQALARLINQLEIIVEESCCFLSHRTLIKQLQLLQELQAGLASLSLRDTLDKIAHDPDFSKNYPLLRQGEVGLFLKQIEDADYTHIDLVQKIHCRLLQLKAIQSTRAGFFSRHDSEFDTRVSVLQKLQTDLRKASLNNEANRRFDVLSKLTARERAVLETHENGIYNRLDNWETINILPMPVVPVISM